MGKKKIIWTKKATLQLFSVMDYYADRNKSDIYSLKLESEIKLKLSDLDFSIALPKKTSLENVYYFTHKHISLLFSIEDKSIVVLMVWDDRRNPDILDSFLNEI